MIFMITVLFAAFTVTQTTYPVSIDDIINVLMNHLRGIVPTERRDIIVNAVVWEDYLPRAVGGVTIGAILGIGGAVMQSVVRNPMTDAYTTGISSGALFGVTLFVIMDFSLLGIGGNWGMVTNAFIFSLIPCAAIILISAFRKITSTMMILVGIGLMYLFSACTTLMKFTANPDDLESIFEWNVGTLADLDSTSMPFLITSVLVMFVLMMLLAHSITVMTSGDNVSHSLGVDPMRLKIETFIIVSICTSLAVCFSGSIGFVGLVIPNIARRFVGSDCKLLIPVSACLGSLLLVSSDYIAKQLILGGLPVGVITALIGSPVFLYLLTRKLKDPGW